MGKSTDYRLSAPGSTAAAPALRLPGRDSFPRVDDHLVEPEISRQERLGDRIVEAAPANAPHGTRHSELDYVVRAHVTAGYRVATDLLTRFDVDYDFASDTAVLKQGIDPETGSRYLEELAFEVVSEQGRKIAVEKAERMIRRGVRRVFALFVKQGEVCEWSASSRTWEPLAPESSIEDPCLHPPLKVEALLDAAAADAAVASALVARDHPVIRRVAAEGEAKGRAEGEAKGKAEGESRGEARGKAEALLSVLEARGLDPGKAARARILACTDPDRLNRWLTRAAVASP